tara:strand:+ start:1539 stop:2210 length:672 start_codon:yes stop_codon:yes gene_type:complete
MNNNIQQSLLRLRNLGFNPNNLLDIGAHHGYWSLSARHVYPNTKYMLIEPIIYNELSSCCKQLPNFDYKNILLFDTETEVDWYEARNTGDSIYRENTEHFKNIKPIKKKTRKLDNVFQNVTFDLVKLDVQGAEIPVLKGGKNLIDRAEVVILELPFAAQWNNGCSDFKTHIDYMNNIGFTVFDIIELHRLGENNLVFQIDILFIKKTSKLVDKFQNIINNQGK